MGKYETDITGPRHRGPEGGSCVAVTFSRYLALKCAEQYRDELETEAGRGQNYFDTEAALRFGSDYTGLSTADKAEVRAFFL